MIDRSSVLAVISATLLSSSTFAGTTLIDFDTDAAGVPYVGTSDSFPSNEYAPLGVASIIDSDPSAGSTFVNLTNPVNVGTDISGYYVNIGAFAGQPATTFEAVFAPSVSAVDFDFALPGGTVNVTAFNGAAVVLDAPFVGVDNFVNPAGFDILAGHATIDGVGPITRILVETPKNVAMIIDNLGFCPSARLDIKPGSCPNSFNRNSNGVLPVALIGSDSFDVADVDLSTVVLRRADGGGGEVAPHEGPPGPQSTFGDSATPFDGDLCDCHELTGDGITDLNLKFQSELVTSELMLDDFSAGELVELCVGGMLVDGTEFEACDCVRLVPPNTPPGVLVVTSNAFGSWSDVYPLDLALDGGGFATLSYDRTFPLTSVVWVTAEPVHQDRQFLGWQVDGGLPTQDGGFVRDLTIQIVIEGDTHLVEAVYEAPPPIDGSTAPTRPDNDPNTWPVR